MVSYRRLFRNDLIPTVRPCRTKKASCFRLLASRQKSVLAQAEIEHQSAASVDWNHTSPPSILEMADSIAPGHRLVNSNQSCQASTPLPPHPTQCQANSYRTRSRFHIYLVDGSTWPKQLGDPRKLQLRPLPLPFLPLMRKMRGLCWRHLDLIGYPVYCTRAGEASE
jgi:hypothetical protein